MAPYLNYYRQGQFGEAYEEAEKFNTPHLFWDPLVRAAALGQLGRTREARGTVDESFTIMADFPVRGRRLVGFFVKDHQLVRILFEGLQKAGLEAGEDTSAGSTSLFPSQSDSTKEPGRGAGLENTL